MTYTSKTLSYFMLETVKMYKNSEICDLKSENREQKLNSVKNFKIRF